MKEKKIRKLASSASMQLVETRDGLWTAQNAYSAKADFFASSVFSSKDKLSTRRKRVLRRKG